MAYNITLEEAEKDVVETFSMYEEWLDKYEYLIDLGKNLELMTDLSRVVSRGFGWIAEWKREGCISMLTVMPSLPRELYHCLLESTPEERRRRLPARISHLLRRLD